jgi:hypothetical protein
MTHQAGRRRHPAALPSVAANPKLAQFPSPQPLGEQERLLAEYVASFPEQASLVAEARAENLRLDLEERQRLMQDSVSP